MQMLQLELDRILSPAALTDRVLPSISERDQCNLFARLPRALFLALNVGGVSSEGCLSRRHCSHAAMQVRQFSQVTSQPLARASR